MRSIVRRDTNTYQAYRRASRRRRVKTPTREVTGAIHGRLGSPHDPDAKVARMRRAPGARRRRSWRSPCTTSGRHETLSRRPNEAAHATTDAPGTLEEIVADRGTTGHPGRLGRGGHSVVYLGTHRGPQLVPRTMTPKLTCLSESPPHARRPRRTLDGDGLPSDPLRLSGLTRKRAHGFNLGLTLPAAATRPFRLVRRSLAVIFGRRAVGLARCGSYGLTLTAKPSAAARPATFDFLGFTLYWRRARSGRWGMWCKTRTARLQRAIYVAADWCRRHRHQPVQVQHAALTRRLQGHFNYFGVSGNSRSLQLLVDATERNWYKWLRRRSNRTRLTWPRFVALLERYPLPLPRIRVRIWGS